MALILLEGLDRTGKSTVAKYFESTGYEVIHLSAPPKGTTQDQYLQEMADIVSSASHKNICLDRSHYGELIWSSVYGRTSLLDEESIDVLREIEDSVGVKRILMTDTNIDAHWKRCVDNKEPLDKVQFTRARALYSTMAHKYGFEVITLPQFLKQFPEAQQFNSITIPANQSSTSVTLTNDTISLNEGVTVPNDTTQIKYPSKTPEQQKLEIANAINDILSKKILKSKGQIYDSLEMDLRDFLNSKLGKLLGNNLNELSFTPEEIKFYKTMYKKAIKGE